MAPEQNQRSDDLMLPRHLCPRPWYPSILADLLLGLGLITWGCSTEQGSFASPVATFRTYQKALAEGDLKRAWSCYSTAFHAQNGNDFTAWVRHWREQNPHLVQDELRRQIADERIINSQIGYLLFDSTTLSSPGVSPFFYFIREPEGWKITTHLDSTFHQQLEKAITRGEFKLPDK